MKKKLGPSEDFSYKRNSDKVKSIYPSPALKKVQEEIGKDLFESFYNHDKERFLPKNHYLKSLYEEFQHSPVYTDELKKNYLEEFKKDFNTLPIEGLVLLYELSPKDSAIHKKSFNKLKKKKLNDKENIINKILIEYNISNESELYKL